MLYLAFGKIYDPQQLWGENIHIHGGRVKVDSLDFDIFDFISLFDYIMPVLELDIVDSRAEYS